MLTREIGGSGIEAGVVGLGTWAMGGWMWGGGDDNASVAAIRAALDAGSNLIDTAPAYGLGHAEALVGRAISGRRDEVVLVTKCGLVWDTVEGTPFVAQGDRMIHRHLGAASIRAELEASLARLGTDRVDLYITHWQDALTPVEETMGALLALKAEGKIRAIGISNATPGDLRAYLACGPVNCVQEAYNMLERGLEATLLPVCRETGVSVLSYSSLALGLLTGSISPDRVFEGDDQRRTDPRFTQENRERVRAFAAEVAPVAGAHGAEVGQAALAWTLAQPGITFALCGARDANQARANARAGEFTLSAADLARIDAAALSHLGPVAGSR